MQQPLQCKPFVFQRNCANYHGVITKIPRNLQSSFVNKKYISRLISLERHFSSLQESR